MAHLLTVKSKQLKSQMKTDSCIQAMNMVNVDLFDVKWTPLHKDKQKSQNIYRYAKLSNRNEF